MSSRLPKENLIRLPILAICGMSLALSAVLLWRGEVHLASSQPDSLQVPSQIQSQPQAGKAFCKSSQFISDNVDVAPTIAVIPAEDLLVEIKALLATGDSADRDMVFTNSLPALVRANPEAAVQFAESTTSDLLRPDTLRVVAQSWAISDPASAENWAARLPDAAERNLELGYVCNEVAMTDPALAAQVVEQLCLGEHTEAVLQNIAQKWATKNLPEAMAWAMARAAGEQRDSLIAQIAAIRSTADPVEAGQVVAAQIPAGPIQNEAVLSVVYQWGTRDMTGAAAWVDQFQSGPTKDLAIKELSGIATAQNSNLADQN